MRQMSIRMKSAQSFEEEFLKIGVLGLGLFLDILNPKPSTLNPNLVSQNFLGPPGISWKYLRR